MIENIERFGSQLKIERLGEIELAPQSHVDLPCRKSTNSIAAQVSLLVGQRNRECSPIDQSTAWRCRVVDINRYISDQVCAPRNLGSVYRIEDGARDDVQRQR